MAPANALIDEWVSQKTSISAYSASLMDYHSYFDVSFKDGCPLVKSDRNATYFLSRLCKISHFAKIFEGLDLQGYQVYGMCQNAKMLDYIVAMHMTFNEIRVLRINSEDPENPYVEDYKIVDKESNLSFISQNGNLYVDCQFAEIYRGVNTYAIGILGTYLHENAISSYYYAKFSTKYNLTEYFIKSEDPTIMEIPKGIRVDQNNQMVYIAVEINKNKYHDRTVYQPGDRPGLDNSNVAIVGYSWTHGVRTWTTVLGDNTYQDSYADMEIYGGFLYVTLNSFSTQYSTNSSQTDINYYKLRCENGYIIFSQTLGSPSDDKVLDMEISYNGIVLLSLINWPFLPHRDSSKQWRTQNSINNLALILIDFSDQILDIEAYDISQISAIRPYPIKFFIMRAIQTKQNYIFISHRSNNQVDDHGGIFWTTIADNNALFSQSLACPALCSRCNPRVTTKCLECTAGSFLYKHSCQSSICPRYTFPLIDAGLNMVSVCKDCHYSCKYCNGPKAIQCSSCCQNGECGPSNDRVPNLGICSCPANTAESNGLCYNKCSLNLAGKLNDMCYTQCPKNSFPSLKYDQLQAQERTQFDYSSPTNCQKYTNHLKFDINSKGLPVLGPTTFQKMPTQFTISFWIMPIVLKTESTLINAFDRVIVKAYTSTQKVYFNFKTGTSTYVEPTYPVSPNDVNQQLSMGTWNFISVSQREVLSGTTLHYQQQMGMAVGNFGQVKDAGNKNSDTVINYSHFINTIYLGSLSDFNPESFSGYMKEVKIYNLYHGLAQMQDESIRLHRLYSYDDSSLVAYWKLNEIYPTGTLEYTIQDYSVTQNSITYSILSKPDYPIYVTDSSQQITFCTFHDVKICQTFDYSGTTPIMTSAYRMINYPTLSLTDLTLAKQTGDELWILPNNTECTQQNQILAKIHYDSVLNWHVQDETMSPLDLIEGKHYQACYYILNENAVFNIFQLYLVYRPRTIDPSNGSIYNRTDNVMQWMSDLGDQANGDVIRFMKDCSSPQINETEIIRSNFPDYDPVLIQLSFLQAGNFFFCWYPVFIQDYLTTPYFESIHDLRYIIQNEPTFNPSFVTTTYMNQDMVILNLEGTFNDGDQFGMAWKGTSYSDCNPINLLGSTFTFNHSSWPGIWFGHDTGINGILNAKMDELQACWMPSSDFAPINFIRLKKKDTFSYSLRVFDYDSIQAQRCPELLNFIPEYGSSTLYETDRIIRFNFKPQQVYPAKFDGPPIAKGRIIIYRGAIKEQKRLKPEKDNNFIREQQITD